MLEEPLSPPATIPEELPGPLQAYFNALPRRVRIFNQRLEVVWTSHPRGGLIDHLFGGDAVPRDELERDRWPVVRVLKSMPRAERLYTLQAPADLEGNTREQTWRVRAWPVDATGEVLVVEEAEPVEDPADDALRIRQLDQDIEDLLRNVVEFLDNGVGGDTLRLPNPHIRHCDELRGCLNPECPAYESPTAERCWEIAARKPDAPESAGLASRFHVCSDCRVFGLASPEPMVRISENFNRLISLLRLKYQETLDVQHRMQQADKLSIMGELLASIAHEIKNPLGIIIGRLDVIGLELDSMPPDVLSEDLGTIYRQANRVRQIIDHLLRMARPEPPALKPLSLNTVILDTLTMVRKTLSDKNIAIETDLEQGLPIVHADQIQMQQVLLNLILNARDAMSDGGSLRIASASDPSEPPSVRVTVADNGEGIPPEQLTRLFSAFHTTKMNKGGTGLGLAVCRRIVNAHNGRIEAESTVGAGTCMKLWFPAARLQS